jgi:16S rRNA (cytosine967-C5)-methyltransferase
MDVTIALGERSAAFRDATLMTEEGLLMTARRTRTDCFYVSVVLKKARS